MKSKLILLGCGHLVTPLLDTLKLTHQVSIITSKNSPRTPIDSCDWLIISTPPRAYEGVLPYLPNEVARGVILISSISVYGEQGDCGDDTLPRPDKAQGELILKTENELRQKYQGKLVIVRPGGLIDRDRHPAYHLAGKALKNSNDRIHLIHENDVRKLILEILARKSAAPKIVNIVNPNITSKGEYYQKTCHRLSLPLPLIEENSPRSKRNISSNALLKFIPNFKFTDLD